MNVSSKASRKGPGMTGARNEEITRSTFLKTTFAAIPAAVLLFAAGCGGDDDDEEEDDD